MEDVKVTKHYKIYNQRFRNVWREDSRFKLWLMPVAGDSGRAYCKFCKCMLKAKFQDLKIHATTKKHKKCSPPNSNIFDNDDEDDEEYTPDIHYIETEITEGTELTQADAEGSRADLVSKKMGQLLLKGFKMLASICETCECILMEDKGGVELCIGCNLDNQAQGGHNYN